MIERFEVDEIVVVGISLEEAVSRAHNGDDLSDYLYWGEDVTESQRNLWYLSMESIIRVQPSHSDWPILAEAMSEEYF